MLLIYKKLRNPCFIGRIFLEVRLIRTNDVLIDGFQDVKILYQYLYMSENHFITIKGGKPTPLGVRWIA